MIERYTLPEMGRIWSQLNRYQKWLDVEIAVCEVQTRRGLIPKEAMETIRARAAFDPARIEEIESTVQHDVIAFLTDVAERVGPDARFIHAGMTSSDVLDTATSLQLKEAGEVLSSGLNRLRGALARRAMEFKDTVCIGRSHGVHAEPTTFGLKMALWYDEVGRDIARLRSAVETIGVGKVSGAVGTFAHLDPAVEEQACALLGLKPAPVSTQVIQRDRHAMYLSTLAVIAGTLEKIAVEIRHLQRTEVLEAEEYFAKGQKGSSAMPHKRNPIVCERIAGLARLMRSYAMAAMENQALWHERDISHSSVERVILPDANILIDYMIQKTASLIEKLLVYPEHMRENLEKTKGLIFSQALLLALVAKGMNRDDAYRVVQDASMECWKTGVQFRDLVTRDPSIRKTLDPKSIEACFDLKVHLRNVDSIFKRAGLISD
jgi:adenylosuccinate lyase